MTLTPEQRDWLALSMVPGVGTALFIKLLARYRSPAKVLAARERELRELVGPKVAARIAQYGDAGDVQAQERAMGNCEATFITLDDPDYPPHLAEIYDPPLGLFLRGEFRACDERAIAIVGTRKATPYGIRMAERLAGELVARGVTIISGLAAGVDAAAHQAAIDAGGRTIAVLGCGVDVVYPKQNADLMDRITRHGAVVSQFAMGAKPSKGHFPYRNRIISGMSLGTLVVQAPESSGALITAHTALEQGREVFAVPGEIGNINSAGPHKLIRQGAKLVESADDILDELDLAIAQETPVVPRVQSEPSKAPAVSIPAPTQKSAAPAAPPVSVQENDILSMLKQDGSFVDEIAHACRISVAEALSSLTMLELKGLVRQFSGKRFAPR